MQLAGADQIVLEAAMQVRSARAAVLAANLANADTPNFARRDIAFASALTDLLDARLAPADGAYGQLATGISSLDGSQSDQDRISANLRLDRNNIDPAQELGRVYDNALAYVATAQLYQSSITRMKSATNFNS